MKAIVTGGAGFIGSHLCKKLLEGNAQVTAFDNLSVGKRENLECESENFSFEKGDVLNAKALDETFSKRLPEAVFHFAAEPDVRAGNENPQRVFRQNVEGTRQVLEACKKTPSVKKIVFASTSTVYGNASVIPTPETYTLLKPVSQYGKTKLEGERLVRTYASECGFDSCILRLANIIGNKSSHGVIFDFVKKLRQNNAQLEILGDGNQCKSYLHVSDCINAILVASNATKGVETFNIGSNNKIKVVKIAEIVKKALNLESAQNVFTGGKQGWKGDVPVMLLDCSKIKKLGWSPSYDSLQAVQKTASEITGE
ncbi:MAG: NAD-dependent epimerase/dehydratase family protein [Candidatus Micrarchaeia archaeon]